jgi:hypothetical protein
MNPTSAISSARAGAPYGSLDVPRAARADFDAATRYLEHDRVERTLFDRLEHGPHVRLALNARNADFWDPNTHTIHWDPHSALRTTHGGRQSPALGLAHEVDHAVHDGRNSQRLVAQRDRRYDNKEERRVILGSEAHAARTLGESTRHDHAGRAYRVASPTTTSLSC